MSARQGNRADITTFYFKRYPTAKRTLVEGRCFALALHCPLLLVDTKKIMV
jgi:hypothetical protein